MYTMNKKLTIFYPLEWILQGLNMPEIRVTVSEKFDRLLDRLMETGFFTSKADIMRFATIAYMKEFGLKPEVGRERSDP
jgi:phenolic acid decarboxylase